MSFFNQTLPAAANNLLAGVNTRVAEAASKTVASLGGVGGFTKTTARSDALDKAAADLQRQAALDAAATGSKDLRAQIDKSAEELAINNAIANNAMVARTAVGNMDGLEQSVSASDINATAPSPADDSHMVKLQEPGGPLVKFVNMPDISESRTVEYEAIAPPQSPSAFQKYKGTASTQWAVNITLTSRTSAEATENLRIMNQLRAWTMPYFGERTRQTYPSKLGAPPPVLIFSGFRTQMIGPVPVVLTSCQWSFPQDVDYIPAYELAQTEAGTTATSNLVPFPTVMKVAIQLVESFSTEQMNGFSLADFRLGRMTDAFKPLGQNSNFSNEGNNYRTGGDIPAPEQAQIANQNSETIGGGRGGRGGPSAEELAYWNADYGHEGNRTVQSVGNPRTRGGLRSEQLRATYVAGAGGTGTVLPPSGQEDR